MPDLKVMKCFFYVMVSFKKQKYHLNKFLNIFNVIRYFTMDFSSLQIQGLCGKYNHNSNDEFISTAGYLTSKFDFIAAFKEKLCPDPQRDDIESHPCSAFSFVSCKIKRLKQ